MNIGECICVLQEKYGDDFNWMSTSSNTFVNELRFELGDKFNFETIAVVAKCGSNDGVLFEIDGIYRIYHLTYSEKAETIRFLEFKTLNEAINYIEKDYVENYM